MVHDELGSPDIKRQSSSHDVLSYANPNNSDSSPAQYTRPTKSPCPSCRSSPKLKRAPRNSPVTDVSPLPVTSTTSPNSRNAPLTKPSSVACGSLRCGDVVDDNRGPKPLDPNDVLQRRTEADYRPESIGTLTRPIDIPGWEHTVRTRSHSSPTLTQTNSNGSGVIPGTDEQSMASEKTTPTLPPARDPRSTPCRPRPLRPTLSQQGHSTTKAPVRREARQRRSLPRVLYTRNDANDARERSRADGKSIGRTGPSKYV